MKTFIILAMAFLPQFLCAQADALILVEKYNKSDLLGDLFFNASFAENSVIYKSAQNILINNNQKASCVKIVSFHKGLKRGSTTLYFSNDSIGIYKTRYSIFTLPKRIKSFFIYMLPDYLKSDSNKLEQDTNILFIERDSIDKIAKASLGYLSEKYFYDPQGNLIEIIKSCTEDSTKKPWLRCTSIANKWEGNYIDHKLINETIFYDDRPRIIIKHKYEEDYLVESIYNTTYDDFIILHKYIYENGILKKDYTYLENGKIINCRTYEWKN